jgi:formate hydrogenlyase transcriptional activator
LKMVEEVAGSGKGLIIEMNSQSKHALPSNEIIQSKICVPMILRDKVMGVLYHDNCFLSSAFKESDLELLAYFATFAGFALDKARAWEEVQILNKKLHEEKLYFEEEHLQSLHFEDIVGESDSIKNVLVQVNQVANTDSTVLILGETGVGKELVARAIHRLSPRGDRPFIRVNCSSLPEGIIASELFGHEKGAFTGATSRRIGRFELADSGSIFLDEVGDLSLDVQIRLLQVLQHKEFERVGGSKTIHSDFRLLAATNRDLKHLVEREKFRLDLYYRLNVFPIYVPPLRERKEDIPILAHYFLKIYATKMRKSLEVIPDEEMDKLVQYHWPGNVRELENIIERGTILNSGKKFKVPELSVGPGTSDNFSIKHTLRENERHHILWALNKKGWKVRGIGGAAELLDIHPSTLTYRMKRLGIIRPKGIPKKRASSLAMAS